MDANRPTKRITTYLLLVLFSLITLVPFVWIFMTSLKTTQNLILRGPFALPDIIHWENYAKAWKVGHFALYYKNSFIVAAVTVIGVLAFSLLGAYAFAYLKFKGKGFWFTMVLLGLLIPAELIIVPLFYDLKSMKLLNSYWALILPQIALNIPFGIFLLRGFMKDIPKALLESARMDGSNELQNLYHIILPLVKPAAISLLIFTVMSSWNSFMLPTILIQSDKFRTVPLGLNYFRGKYTIDICMTAAGSNIIAAPVIVIYLIFQRNMIRGMVVGALKE